jgi:hypothetical protein
VLKYKDLLTNWIVKEDQPFTTVEASSFREMQRSLYFDVAQFSADTIKSHVMFKFQEKKLQLREILQVGDNSVTLLFQEQDVLMLNFNHTQNVPGHIAFTIDGWTSPNLIPFMGITAHFIDRFWCLREVLLDFVKLSGTHSGENLFHVFISCLESYGILTKVRNNHGRSI